LPEGPEIRRAADEIAEVLVGETAHRVSFSQPRLRHQGRRLSGQVVTEVETRGKAMLTHFDHGLTIYSHNQLYGVWRVTPPGRIPASKRSLRLAIQTDAGNALLYSASDISIWDTGEIDQHPFLAKLGPDILSRGLDWRQIADRLQEAPFSSRKLGDTLLDQGFVAGLGNYLRAEILFAARLSPDQRPRDLTRGQIGTLARTILELGLRSYRTGGITNPPRLEQTLKREGLTYEQRRFAVFGREAAPCYGCGAPVQRKNLGARPFYYCRHCQDPGR
jgi:endonuclease-8